MRTITELKKRYPEQVFQTVYRAYHAPGHPMTNKITDKTYEKCVSAIKAGKIILIGNAPYGKGEMIARSASRYHGFTIRTIRAV